jgi:hypothetical protein
MCDHLRKLIGKLDYKTGFAPESCLDCGENLGKIPATFQAVTEYCNQKKISSHFQSRTPYETLPLNIDLRG